MWKPCASGCGARRARTAATRFVFSFLMVANSCWSVGRRDLFVLTGTRSRCDTRTMVPTPHLRGAAPCGGRSFRMDQAVICHLDGAKIAEEWEIADVGSLDDHVSP